LRFARELLETAYVLDLSQELQKGDKSPCYHYLVLVRRRVETWQHCVPLLRLPNYFRS